jgi:hypothetical protein
MKMFRAGLSCLLIASTACGSDAATGTDVQLDALPVTAATVVAAVEFMTSVPIPVVADCTGTPAINCTGGTAGATIPVPFTHTTPTAVQTAPGVFTFGTDITISSAPTIPISTSVVNCSLGINTTAGTSQTVHLGGTATFTSFRNDGVTDELAIAPDLTGVESADVSISGGSICSALGGVQGMMINSLLTSFDQLAGQLCGAPGPALFETCPVPSRATRYRISR